MKRLILILTVLLPVTGYAVTSQLSKSNAPPVGSIPPKPTYNGTRMEAGGYSGPNLRDINGYLEYLDPATGTWKTF
jgi:hypothetical protein